MPFFIVVPRVRTKMRKKGKRDKMMSMDKPKENTLIYIHTPADTQTYTHTDTHMHIYTLFVIQVRYCFLTLIESDKLLHIEGRI